MAAALSAPPLANNINSHANSFRDDSDLDHNHNIHHHHHMMDDDDEQHYNMAAERPRAVQSPTSLNDGGGDRAGLPPASTGMMLPPVSKKPSRASLKAKLSITTPSDEDLRSQWSSLNDKNTTRSSNTSTQTLNGSDDSSLSSASTQFRSQLGQASSDQASPRSTATSSTGFRSQLFSLSPSSTTSPTTFPHQQIPPSRITHFPEPEVLIRDFAYNPPHFMHHGPPPKPSQFESSIHAPSFIPGRDLTNSAGPHRGQADEEALAPRGRRMSDSAEMNPSRNNTSGASIWKPGPWGGDGGMYENMEPLPSTSFKGPGGLSAFLGGEDEGDDLDGSQVVVGGGNNRRARTQSHRKSRSFADVPSYERGRRRGDSGGGSKGGGGYGLDVNGGGGSDPAGREALRMSRGITTTDVDAGQEDVLGEDAMFDLSLSSNPDQRPRRDSHTMSLPSRTFAEIQALSGQTHSSSSDLPLDMEESHSNTSPHRESLGPEDEEFAGRSLVLYDFEAENSNELGVREGEIIMVSYLHGQGWLVAENGRGEQGLVPKDYVRLLSEMEWTG